MKTYTPDQLALLAHIQAQNAAFEAKCIAEKATFYTLSVDDIDFWAEHGVMSISDYNRHNLHADFSDTYKEVNGFRPRNHWTDQEMENWLFAQRNK